MHVSGKVGFAPVLPGLLALAASHSFAAQIPINTPTTINYAITGDVAVGLGSTSPFTVSLVPGGNISGYLYGSGDSTVDVLGGSVGTYLQADADSVFNVYGSDLTLTDPTPYFTGTQYDLQRTLQDGNTINLHAYRYDNGQFVLHNVAPTVPEPGTLPLLGLGLGGVALAALRRRRA